MSDAFQDMLKGQICPHSPSCSLVCKNQTHFDYNYALLNHKEIPFADGCMERPHHDNLAITGCFRKHSALNEWTTNAQHLCTEAYGYKADREK